MAETYDTIPDDEKEMTVEMTVAEVEIEAEATATAPVEESALSPTVSQSASLADDAVAAQSYSEAKARLDDIVKQVRAKDVSLERSLDLLEEGVRLANQCTELIDQTRWEDEAEEAEEDAAEEAATEEDAASAIDEAKGEEPA